MLPCCPVALLPCCPVALLSLVPAALRPPPPSGVFFSKVRAAPLKPFQDNGLARRRLRRLLHKWGNVPLWVSEFGTGRGALQLARHIIKDLSTLLPSAWVYWQAVEDLGAGWGLLEMPMQHPTTTATCGGGAADGSAAEKGAVAAGGQVDRAQAAAVPQARATSSGSLEGGKGQGPHQPAAAKAVLHPNYFVLHFLVQAVPVGSRLCAVKGLGRRGVGVWRPASSAAGQHGCWSVLYINPSARKARRFRIVPSSFPAVLGGQGGSTAAAPAPTKVSVTLLDVVGQQPVTVVAGASLPQLAAGWHTLAPLELAAGDGGAVVEVPPRHICLAQVTPKQGFLVTSV